MMTGMRTKNVMRRVVISAGVRIWYRLRIPPSCRTVEFPPKAGLKMEDDVESNPDEAWRAERRDGEPENNMRCFGKREEIVSSSLDKIDSCSAIASFLREVAPSRGVISIQTTCLEPDSISTPCPGARWRKRDPQRLESDAARSAKDWSALRRTYGNWREEGADPSNFTRVEDGSSERRSDACSPGCSTNIMAS